MIGYTQEWEEHMRVNLTHLLHESVNYSNGQRQGTLPTVNEAGNANFSRLENLFLVAIETVFRDCYLCGKKKNLKRNKNEQLSIQGCQLTDSLYFDQLFLSEKQKVAHGKKKRLWKNNHT